MYRIIPHQAVFVTGAAGGIGRSCCAELSRLGYRVFAGVRSEDDAKNIQINCPCEPIIIDITCPNSIRNAVESLSAALGDEPLAGLINNAGIAVAGPLELISQEAFKKQLDVNVIGQLMATQAFLPLLRRGRGCLIFMSSISARVATPLLGAYAASKFALEALIDVLRMELYADGINVVSIQPGPVATAIWHKSIAASNDNAGDIRPEIKRYSYAMSAAREYATRAATNSIAPERVAKIVGKALLTKNPRRRYLVGGGAVTVAILITLLPATLLDRFLRFKRLPSSGTN